MVRLSASEAADSGLIPNRVQQMTLKLIFTASLLDARHYRESLCGEQAEKFTCSAVGKGTYRDSPILMW